MNTKLFVAIPAVGLALALPHQSARAQDAAASTAAYIAWTFSPPGSFAPTLSRKVFEPDGSPAVLHMRFGTLDDPGGRANSFGATGEFPFWRGRLGINGGIQTFSDLTFAMVGADYQTVMSRGPLGTGNTSSTLIMNFRSEFGVGVAVQGDNDDTMISGGVSVPMAVPIGRDIQFVPFISPGLAWGMVLSGGSYTSEVRAMAGGGLVIHNPSRIDLTIGFHKVFIENGATLLGASLTWNR